MPSLDTSDDPLYGTNRYSNNLDAHASAAAVPTKTKSNNGNSRSFLEAEGEEARILETIDKLRALGVNKDYPLPQIIVCGAQSAGKSSVLEAITAIPFPRDSGVCTKFKTTVTLSRSEEEYVRLTITPCESRPVAEKARLSQFGQERISRDDWDSRGAYFMDQAKKQIFDGKDDKSWTKDVLCITIAGPGQRSLQLVDLPGIIGVSDEEGDVELVQEIVEAEMKLPHSFMLAVVKATDDLQNHSILRLCKKHDKKGERTLGVITRPDESRDNASKYIKMVMKDKSELSFNHDWHVLLNRSSEDLLAKKTAKQRDDKERAFFNRNPWSKLDPRDFGIDALRARLRDMLFSLAKTELPKLQDIMTSEKRRLDKELDDLGGERLQQDELKKVFRACVKRLKKVAREHAEGNYKADIRSADPGSALHLRSRVVEESEVYCERMIKKGHAWALEGTDALDPHEDIKPVYQDPSPDKLESPKELALDAALSEVGIRLNKTRGTHLPGFNDPKHINQDVWKRSESWKTISQSHIEIVYACCERYFQAIMPRAFSKTGLSVVPESGFGNYEVVARRFHRKHIIPALAERKKRAEDELLQLEKDRLEPRQNFDRQFLVEQRMHRQTRNFARTVDGVFESKVLVEKKKEIGPDGIASGQRRHTQQEQTEESAEDFLMASLSDYDILRRNFMANVLTQVIERHLLRQFEEIVPDEHELEISHLEELVKLNGPMEGRKTEIRERLATIEESLKALDDLD